MEADCYSRLYDYLPTDIEAVKKDPCYCAGFTFVVKTTDVVELLKWYVLCALQKDCMGPSGANHTCTFAKDDQFTKYAKCHRYDQSVVNILLANLFEHKPNRYVVSQPGGVELWRLKKNVYGKEFWHITRNIYY
ncbi:unnamed protein product [Cylicocyclus nassatus]|uniref:Uncharacterized protein n=1 Tax=Cylicocyclus nassatus TaxID=53992 RepID=A0AA36MCK1_CYLNA|nr:unnamed protein product [Cylicocyclus nassatus]